METISESTTVKAREECLSTTVDSETVILQAESGKYYGFNEVATRIWDSLQEERSVEELRDELLAEYDVSADRCERDLRLVLATMAEADLVEIIDE